MWINIWLNFYVFEGLQRAITLSWVDIFYAPVTGIRFHLKTQRYRCCFLFTRKRWKRLRKRKHLNTQSKVDRFENVTEWKRNDLKRFPCNWGLRNSFELCLYCIIEISLNNASTANTEEVMKFYNPGDKTFQTDFSYEFLSFERCLCMFETAFYILCVLTVFIFLEWWIIEYNSYTMETQ